MTRYHLTVYLHVTDDGGMLFNLVAPSLTSVRGDRTVTSLHRAGDDLTVEGMSVMGALEILYREANIGEPVGGERGDWVRSYRVRDRSRSLSVGDVVIVNGEVAYQCLSMGWGVMTSEQMAQVRDLIDERWWMTAADENAEKAGAR